MLRTLTSLVLICALLGIAGETSAGTGFLRLSWDDCDPIVVNKDWNGPIFYRLVMSVTGSDVANQGHRTRLSIGPEVRDAWRFDEAGCNADMFFVSHNGVSKSCPAFQGERPLGLNQYSYDPITGVAVLDVANVYDVLSPLLMERYTLYQAVFDHAYSDTGAQDPTVACGFADAPLCLVLQIQKTEILLPIGKVVSFNGVDNAWVTWQGAELPIGCALPIQVNPTTWGRLKGLYR